MEALSNGKSSLYGLGGLGFWVLRFRVLRFYSFKVLGFRAQGFGFLEP